MKMTFAAEMVAAVPVVVVAVAEGLAWGALEKVLDGGVAHLDSVARKHHFSGKQGEVLTLLSPAHLPYDRVVLVGLGAAADRTLQTVAEAGGAACAALPAHQVEAVQLLVDGDGEEAAHFAQGFLLRSYRFDKYFTKTPKEKKPILNKVVVVTAAVAAARKAFARLSAVAEGVFLARNVVSEPGNVIYPESLAALCGEMKKLEVTVTVLGEKKLQNLGMGALLGVGQGSARPPCVVTLQYQGSKAAKNKQPIAFIGKGVTFDTGGISIKPSSGMEDMKYDMAGSAAVIGVIHALAARKAKVNAVGVIGLVENMPDGNAQRPGDVVKSLSGQTIEVINTDAEGRLVLCDLLTYTQNMFKPRAMVNLATLTGAIVLALGNEYAGLFSNHDGLAEQLHQAGAAVQEKLWRFPMGAAYDKQLNSDIADMKNASNERVAGSIFAAQFLARFVDAKTPWAHLDIAGTAWTRKDLPLSPKGATAYGVRLLEHLVKTHFEA